MIEFENRKKQYKTFCAFTSERKKNKRVKFHKVYLNIIGIDISKITETAMLCNLGKSFLALSVKLTPQIMGQA